MPSEVREQLRPLLEQAFPSTFEGRTHFKQWPDRSLIAFDGVDIVGQAGLDDRAIRIGPEVVGISGLIDICGGPDRRRRGIGSALIEEAEDRARRGGAPFLVLMADRRDLYERHGFERISPALTTWLGVDDQSSVALIERDLSDCFMAKSLTIMPWPENPIDLLGYLF